MKSVLMKSVLIAFLVGCPVLVFAISFPLTSWDISAEDETGWGQAIPTTKTDFGSGVFDAAYPTALRATGDLSIWRISFKATASGTVFDLAKDGHHRVRLTDRDSTYYGMQFDCNESVFTFRGGIWDFDSYQHLILGYGKRGNKVTFDNAVVTNVSNVSLSYYETNDNNHDHTLVLTNGTAMKVANDFYLGNNGGYNNTVEINAGCAISVGRNVWLDTGGRAREHGNMKMVIRGDEARLSVKGDSRKVYVGVNSSDAQFEIADCGQLDCTSLVVGGVDMTKDFSVTSNNVVRMVNGATATIGTFGMDRTHDNVIAVTNSTIVSANSFAVGGGASGEGCYRNRMDVFGADAVCSLRSLTVGSDASASNNIAVIAGGASLSTSSSAYVGESGANNALIFSNSTYTVNGTLVLGRNAGATNSLLRIAGSQAGLVRKFSTWSADWAGPFGAAGCGVFELADHVSFSNNIPSMTIGKLSDGNVFRLRDGASISSRDGGLIYTAGEPASGLVPATKDNRLEVLNGSELQCYRVRAMGDNCGIIVSNSALSIVNSYEEGIILGGTGATNNYLRLEGDAPTIRTSWTINGVKMSNGARLEFALPATPYAEMAMQVCKIVADSTCSLTFDTSAIDKITHDRLRYHLVRIYNAQDANRIDASVLAAANATLAPKGGTLAWEGRDLYLTFKSNKGLILIFR